MGNNLSVVASLGIELLEFQEGQKRVKQDQKEAERRVDMVKAGLLNNPAFDHYKLFPEYFYDDTPVSDEDFLDPNMSWDFSDVRWEVPDAEEWARIQEEMRSNTVSVPIVEEESATFADGTKFNFDRLVMPDTPDMQDIPKFDLSGIPDAPSEEVADNEREWI